MRHPLLVATVASAGLVLATACTSPGAPERAAPSTSPSAQAEDVPSPRGREVVPSPREGEVVAAKVVDTDFAPVTIEVAAGETVRWKQVGDQPHSVTAADGSFDSSPECGPLDSDRCLGMGDDFAHAFDEPGTFAYYCRVHGLPDGTGMAGTVVVR